MDDKAAMHWHIMEFAPVLTFRALMGRTLEWLPAAVQLWLRAACIHWTTLQAGRSTGVRGNGRTPLRSACPDRSLSWDCMLSNATLHLGTL